MKIIHFKKKSVRKLFTSVFLLTLLAGLLSQRAIAAETINLNPTDGEDMTPIVRKALEEAQSKDIRLVFAHGTYKFLPDLAKERYCFITNHENGLKRIIFDFVKFNSVTIEGNGARLIFHGLCAPFVFDGCKEVTFRNVSIDWDKPFDFVGEVIGVNAKEGWREIKPIDNGVNWSIERNQLKFPDIDGFNFLEPGHTLAFDPKTKAVAYGAWDMQSKPQKVEKLPNGNLKFYEKLRNYPTVGSLLNSSGIKIQNRYSPAVWGIRSQNILLEGVIVNYSLGMGFMFEKSEDIVLRKCGVYLPENTKRVVASNADATHFCNCKGDILVEDSRFENMLDDGTNVHGTYMPIVKILDKQTVRAKFAHSQQTGFEFASPKDIIWFVQQPNPQRGPENEVLSVKRLNEEYLEITFKNPLPTDLKEGDILENKTWNPTFTMRNCVIKNNRARSIVLKTPLKTVIENNLFSSMMSAVLFRGETYFWYESGEVTDVLIQNNRFVNVAHGGPEHSVLYITPRLGNNFDQTLVYDKNIRFINNDIETFDNRIVWADRADGLLIKGNKIKKTSDFPAQYPNAPMFEFENCRDVEILQNTIVGSYPAKKIKADKSSEKSLIIKNNKGL